MSGSNPDDGRGFLADLTALIPRFQYKGRQQFLDTWGHEMQRQLHGPPGEVIEWILFTNVDEHTFSQDFNSTDESALTRWCAYDASQHLLLVRMIRSVQHEIAAATFNDLFLDAVEPTGLKYALRDLKSSTIRGTAGAKEADFSWAPRRCPPGRSRDWPTVVLEVAFAESKSKLTSDVRFWLHQSNGDVKMVLTLSINRQVPEITIEKWESQNGRHYRTQRLVISRGENGQIKVDGGSLVIEFIKLFLRPADVPEETDIEIDMEKLQLLGSAVWEEMF